MAATATAATAAHQLDSSGGRCRGLAQLRWRVIILCLPATWFGFRHGILKIKINVRVGLAADAAVMRQLQWQSILDLRRLTVRQLQ